MDEKKARVTIYRYNPEEGSNPRYETYEFPYQKGMTVLDALMYVRHDCDSTLAFNYECRYGYCGSCAIEVNGEPALVCRTLAKENMILNPLSNVPVVRDLVVDRTMILNELARIRPFLERKNVLEKEPEQLLPADFSTFRVVSRCISCLSCMSTCPSYTEGKNSFAGPALITEIARRAFDPRDGGDRVRTASEEGLFNCTMCGKCVTVCPYEIDVPNMIMMPMRRTAIERNIGPVKEVAELEGLIEATGKAFVEPSKSPYLSKVDSEVKVENSKGRVGLFLGCLLDYDFHLHGMCESAVNVLRANQFEISLPKKQVCCGLPFIRLGQVDLVQKHLLKHNLQAFEDVPRTVSLCAGCTSTLRNWYPKLCKDSGLDYKLQAFDFSEFLLKQRLVTDTMDELNLKVTYHDPCDLNRGLKISAEPRKIIENIPGVKLIEMDEADRCCGGTLKMLNPKLSYKIAGRKAKMIKKLDVGAVITGCPRCVTQISSALKLKGAKGIRVLHLAQLLDLSYKKQIKDAVAKN